MHLYCNIVIHIILRIIYVNHNIIICHNIIHIIIRAIVVYKLSILRQFVR